MKKLKGLIAVILSAVLGVFGSFGAFAAEDFQIDREELEFLCGFCEDKVAGDEYFSDEFALEYQAALDNAGEALLNYDQLTEEQVQEAYWNLFKAYNMACVYNQVPMDVDGSGAADINDVSDIQKSIAGLETLNFSQLYLLGFVDPSDVSIVYVTDFQKMLAGYSSAEFPEEYVNLQNNAEERNIQVNEIFYSAYQEKEQEGHQSNGIKVFVSPSNQYANIYSAGDTNEMIQCNKIAAVVERCLLEHGFEVMRAPQGQDMYDTIDQSNEWGADLHLPIHTNALNYSYTGGTMIMVYDMTDSENVKAAREILDSLSPITPGPDYSLIVRKDLHELSDINAMSVYVECEYHDTAEGATFIINNIEPIGEAIAKGVCNYYGVEW